MYRSSTELCWIKNALRLAFFKRTCAFVKVFLMDDYPVFYHVTSGWLGSCMPHCPHTFKNSNVEGPYVSLCKTTVFFSSILHAHIYIAKTNTLPRRHVGAKDHPV